MNELEFIIQGRRVNISKCVKDMESDNVVTGLQCMIISVLSLILLLLLKIFDKLTEEIKWTFAIVCAITFVLGVHKLTEVSN